MSFAYFIPSSPGMSIAFSSQYPIHLNQVRGVDVVFQSDKVLLDTPGRNEAVEESHASSLVVGATCASTAERLLTYNGTGTFLVIVYVAGRVAELVGSVDESLAIRVEAKQTPLDVARGIIRRDHVHSTSESISSSGIDELQGLLIVVIVVHKDLIFIS